MVANDVTHDNDEDDHDQNNLNTTTMKKKKRAFTSPTPKTKAEEKEGEKETKKVKRDDDLMREGLPTTVTTSQQVTTPTIPTQEEEKDDDDDDDDEILGTDCREKGEQISPVEVHLNNNNDGNEEDEEERKYREERITPNEQPSTTNAVVIISSNNISTEKSQLEMHFGKRKPNPPKELKIDQKPKERDGEALPEELDEWKTFAEAQLAELINKSKQKLIDWFHVKSCISATMIACPARELREVLKDLRDNKIIGNSMRPYLIYLREIFDGAEKYRDKLDADVGFTSSEEDDDSEDEDDDDDDNMLSSDDDDADDDASDSIPEITRTVPFSKAARTSKQHQHQHRRPPNSSSRRDALNKSEDSAEESDEEEEEIEERKPKYDRQRYALFSKFLALFVIEHQSRVENGLEAALLLQADGCKEFTNSECVQFLGFLEKQGKIMIDGGMIYVI